MKYKPIIYSMFLVLLGCVVFAQTLGADSSTVPRQDGNAGPPHLVLTIEPPVLKIVNYNWVPYPAVLTVKIHNRGALTVNDLRATFIPDSGVALPAGERAQKYLLTLDGGEETSIAWQILPIGNQTSGSFKILITGVGIEPLTVDGQLDIPALTPRIGFKSSGRWVQGQVVNLDLFAYNLQDAQKFITGVKYDPKQLRLVYVSRGTFFVEDEGLAEWNSGEIDNRNGLATQIFGIRSQPFSGDAIALVRLNFIVIGAGNGQISLEDPKIVSSRGIERAFDFVPLRYQIEEEKK
jgi:hypothetical protein